MATIIGFIDLFGVRAGDKGWAELEGPVRTIRSSPEVHDLVAGMASTARQVLGQGARVMANRPPERPSLRVA